MSKISIPIGKFKLSAETYDDGSGRAFIVVGVEDENDVCVQDVALFEKNEENNIEFRLWRDCNDECYTDRGEIEVLKG